MQARRTTVVIRVVAQRTVGHAFVALQQQLVGTRQTAVFRAVAASIARRMAFGATVIVTRVFSCKNGSSTIKGTTYSPEKRRTDEDNRSSTHALPRLQTWLPMVIHFPSPFSTYPVEHFEQVTLLSQVSQLAVQGMHSRRLLSP